MARIRAALRQADSRPDDEAVPPPRLAPEPQSACDNVDEIPFIEVGGKAMGIEASPSVLAVDPDAVRKTKARRIAEASGGRTVQRDMVTPETPAPIQEVVFRALPVEKPALRPAQDRFLPELITLHRPDHSVSEQYRVLATELQRQMPSSPTQVLLITAMTPEADSATVLLNLAITRARHAGSRTVVVDGYLCRPTIASRLGLPDAPGLGEVLSGQVSLRRALQETGVPNLLALTAGTAIEGTPHLVAREAMRAVLRHLRAAYDWVLIHAPCWDGRPDVVALGAACDAVYLVLTQEEANTPRANDLGQFIAEQGSRLRGNLITRSA